MVGRDQLTKGPPERRAVFLQVSLGIATVLAAALLTKMAVFDPNWPVKPYCLGGNKFRALEGPQTSLFRERLASTMLYAAERGYRADSEYVYVSLLDRDWHEVFTYTMKIVRTLEETDMNSLVQIENYIEVKKSRGQFPPRPTDGGEIDCELIAAIAIR